MKNKFNRLTSKEWLPFQKSWFKYTNREKLYKENVRFFTAAEGDDAVVYHGPEPELFNQICEEENIRAISPTDLQNQAIQFTVIDLMDEISHQTSLPDYKNVKERVINILQNIYSSVVHRRFIVIFIPNIQAGETYYPYAWDLAKSISQLYSLKDEKIGCIASSSAQSDNQLSFTPDQSVVYSLYFRKDENCDGLYKPSENNFFKRNKQNNTFDFTQTLPAWFILKPQPRKKNEILHPAKYPEDLVEMFIKTFTKEQNNVFDPMSGTGSTQRGALKLKRNAYGTELSKFFADIANNRCEEYIRLTHENLFNEINTQTFKILNKDARAISKADFPPIDYMITSPPYWDMLNMKGAENQAKRIEKGLQTNYSDDPDDLGNIQSYQDFLGILQEVYFNIASLMKPGSYMTIVVKNIKKKGSNYPFAWDLANLLQQKLILLPEVFWCQDDISIAPYGYGNTWVSNTFHQYCLNFQVPKP